MQIAALLQVCMQYCLLPTGATSSSSSLCIVGAVQKRLQVNPKSLLSASSVLLWKVTDSQVCPVGSFQGVVY